MKSQHDFESFATTVNDHDDRLPPMSRCYNIGIGGGCGLRCSAFCDGECDEPYEFSHKSLIEEFDKEELVELYSYYPKFKDEIEEANHNNIEYRKRKF